MDCRTSIITVYFVIPRGATWGCTRPTGLRSKAPSRGSSAPVSLPRVRPPCLSSPAIVSITDQGIRPAPVTLRAMPIALRRCARTARPDRGERDRELVEPIKEVVHGRLLASGDRRQPSGSVASDKEPLWMDLPPAYFDISRRVTRNSILRNSSARAFPRRWGQERSSTSCLLGVSE